VPAVAARSRAPFLVVAGALFVLLLDGNLPTPLYAVYRERFGFSGTELTLIFAIYAVALIPSLLVFGQLSDRLGRRRVIAGGLCVAAVGLALLAAAQSTAWLFVARGVQGLGAALVSPAALSIVTTTFAEGADRQKALGVWSAIAAGGGAFGLLLGGSSPTRCRGSGSSS
jgi:MFS family permease